MSFDVAAAAYDAFMGRFSAPLAERFVEWARPPDGGRALDVGCGTGALTAVLSRRFGASEVAGVDPSSSFVEAAAARFHLADIRHGTAEALPFEDDVFSATLAALVVHFMTDAAAGAREMVRVTRPGGVVAACVWDFVGGRAPQTRFFRAFADVVPDVEDETGRLGGREGDIVRLLSRAGCREVEQGELTVEVEYAGFDEWWEPYTRGVAPAGQQLARLDEPTRTRVRARALELVGDQPFTVEATAWAARGIA
jgi:ubiquinone/menaquinone biosynthesis C-methylase UbiE